MPSITFVVFLVSLLRLSSAWVILDKALLENLHLNEALPIFSLGSAGVIPPAFLDEFISTSAPNITLYSNESLGGHFAYDGDRLVAFVDGSTGETQLFPDFGSVPPAEGAEINITRAFEFLNLNETFPKDHTNVSVVPGNSLVGLDFLPGEQSTRDPQVYLSNAIIQRNITANSGRSYPVCGPGSTASFSFDIHGNVHSLSYLWHPATLTGQLIKPNSTKTMYNNIVASLTPIGKDTSLVKVEGLDLCFYDSGSKFIQPVIRVWATIHANSIANTTLVPTRIESYFPIGAGSPEPLPAVTIPKDSVPDPVLPDSECHAGASRTVDRRGILPNIKVGRYVVRDDTKQWVTNAQNFLSNLRRSSPFANFVDSQYYWAYPYLFTSDKNRFVNDVHVAELEAHGSWHLFSTEKNCCDLVDIETDVPKDGYGGGSGGSLAYWILHACSVIPTPTDFPAAERRRAFDDWFKVFNGMHAVVGYRTSMKIADDVMPTFGRAIALGAPFVFRPQPQH